MRWISILVGGAGIALGASAAQAQTVTVDRGTELQTIEGFGAFGPAKVWWEAGPWHDQAYVDLIVDDLGSTLVRTQVYWDGEDVNDDADPGTFNWAGFDFGPASDNGKQFDFLRALAAKGNVRVIASVWTPPVWMKQNPDDSLAVFCDGQCGGTLDPALREELAEYLAAYVIRLRDDAGIELFALSVQNELIFANPFESCVYTAEEYAETLKVVGARFAAEGLTTRLFGPEHMGSYDWNTTTNLFGALLDDPDAAQYLDAYAVHGYLDGVSAEDIDPAGWTAIHERVSAAGKPLWMTETSDGGAETEYAGAFRMAKQLHTALRYGQINAWVYWYYAGALVENNQPLPLYDLFKGWYRYVRPGFVQVESAVDDAEVLATAFTRGDSMTLVLVNDATSEKTVTLSAADGALPPFTAYRAAEGAGFVELGALPDATVTLVPRSITTLSYVAPDDPGDPPGGSGGTPAGTGGSDAGAGPRGTGATPGSGATNEGGGRTAADAGDGDGGCACRSGAPPARFLGGALALALGALAGWRRRRPLAARQR